MLKCRKCGETTRQMKGGFTIAKSQKYLCGHCNCRYTPVTKHYSEEVRQIVIKEHYAGASGRAIGSMHGMSKSNVYRWIKKNTTNVDK